MHRTWKVTMERYQEVIVALSESVNKKCLKRPQAEKSRWRHIRLAFKLRYLGKHASHTKSYYGTLSGSHSCSSKIRQQEVPEAPRSGEFTMTSQPVGLETTFSQKPCIAHGKIFMERCQEVISTPLPAFDENKLSEVLFEWEYKLTKHANNWNQHRTR